MTTSEFDTFLNYFGAAFPEPRSWLSSQPDDTFRLWRGTLADVPLDGAKLAVQKLHGGDETMPKHWSEFPARIRKIGKAVAAQNRPSYVGGQRTFKCRLCEDTGWVSVWHCVTMAQVRARLLAEARGLSEDKLPAVHWYHGARCCTCERGVSVFETYRQRGKELPLVYDPAECCLMKPGTHAEQVEWLYEWLDNYKPENYVSEFDKYNNR